MDQFTEKSNGVKDYLKTWGPLVWFRQFLEYYTWVFGGPSTGSGPAAGGAPHWQKQKLLKVFMMYFTNIYSILLKWVTMILY